MSKNLPKTHIAGALLLGTVLATGAGLAWAHSGATGIVKDRMDHMKGIAAAMKAIGAMVTQKSPYDGAVVREHALKISDMGGPAMTALFPAGPINPPSEATPAIWTDWARFSALADDMSSAATALAADADGPDKAALAFRTLAATCKDCHQDFRQKKQN